MCICLHDSIGMRYSSPAGTTRMPWDDPPSRQLGSRYEWSLGYVQSYCGESGMGIGMGNEYIILDIDCSVYSVYGIVCM